MTMTPERRAECERIIAERFAVGEYDYVGRDLLAALDAERARTREVAERVARDWRSVGQHGNFALEHLVRILDRHCGPETAEEREVREAQAALCIEAASWAMTRLEAGCRRTFAAAERLRAAEKALAERGGR